MNFDGTVNTSSFGSPTVKKTLFYECIELYEMVDDEGKM